MISNLRKEATKNKVGTGKNQRGWSEISGFVMLGGRLGKVRKKVFDGSPNCEIPERNRKHGQQDKTGCERGILKTN